MSKVCFKRIHVKEDGLLRLAGHHFTGPTFISANFILFSEDEFAVMCLDLQCTALYHRV